MCVRVRDHVGWFKCGTGFYARSDGLVLTAAHVVPDGAVDITVYDGDMTIPYELVRHQPDADIVSLRPKARRTVKPLPIARTYTQGELVVVAGFPGNFVSTNILVAVQGILGAKHRLGNKVGAPLYHIVDASIAPGHSGAPS